MTVAAASAGPTGPLTRVMRALQAGADSRSALSAQTGLDRDLVDAALRHLIRMGRVRAEELGSGCPSQGCGACPSGGASGLPTCLAGPAPRSTGLVAIRLVSRPPD